MLTRNSKDAWSSEKILTVMAGSMLALYSIKLIYEYATETEEEEQDTKEDAGQETLGADLVRGCCCCPMLPQSAAFLKRKEHPKP